MHSPILIDHFENPRNAGELPPPAVSVEVMNPACGDIMRLSAQWSDERIARAAFKVRGCTAAIAAGSAVTELLTGRNLEEIKALRKSDVEEALGGLINESKHVAVLAIDAVRALVAKIPA